MLSKQPSPEEMASLDSEQVSLTDYNAIQQDCFLGTAPSLMPKEADLDKIMIGVNYATDIKDRAQWGDDANCEMFDTWDDWIPNRIEKR